MNRTAVWGGVALIAVASFWYLNQGPAPTATTTTTTKHAPVAKEVATDLTAQDFSARFAPSKVKLRNLFLPVVKADNGGGDSAVSDKQHIPSTFAGGEADWAFKGIAVSNGLTMALLENDSKHQGGYVKEGDRWKTSKLMQVSVDKIVLRNDEGDEQVVMRFVPTVAAGPEKAAAPATLPPATPPGQGLNPANPNGAIIGPIGRPGRRFQLQPGGGIVISQ
ncbi:MAG TPA: hypothetical protein VG944_10970 [Fimbriimonas sp.]|nr:hypothetical protein [Fimbriimonas sp.]